MSPLPTTPKEMEQVNQELEQYLWLFVNQLQDNWADLFSKYVSFI